MNLEDCFDHRPDSEYPHLIANAPLDLRTKLHLGATRNELYAMAAVQEKQFRIFVLGAGFSQHAGLPLWPELWSTVIRRAKKTILYENKLRPDLDHFVQYKTAVTGGTFAEETIDFEEFMGFLDIEHFLGLRGRDTWSATGNESQHIIRNLIAEDLFERQQAMSGWQWAPYMEFARKLLPEDYVLTFNYDTIVESALEGAGAPFRLFPSRYAKVYTNHAVGDSAHDEVVVLKLHGSIDWFDYAPVEDELEYFKEVRSTAHTRHPVFAKPEVFEPRPITEGPRFPNDPLRKVYRTRKLDSYFGPYPSVSESPLILAPSSAKLLYASPLKEFWYGMKGAGALNFCLTIIGFSLPPHDEYVRQILFEMVDNYQNYDPKVPHWTKRPLRFVNLASSEAERNVVRERYRFVDWRRTETFWNGFGPQIVGGLFS